MRLVTDIDSNCWNISAHGVVKSAFKIIRAARYCNLFILSMFELDVEPQEIEP